MLSVDSHQLTQPSPQLGSEGEDPVDVLGTCPSVPQIALLLRAHGIDRRPRERSGAAGLQVRDLLEDGKLRTRFLESSVVGHRAAF